MATIDKILVIKAPPEKIFNFVIKSSNLTKLWSSLLEITNEKLLPNGGYCANYKYKMAGTTFKGKSECIEVMPYKWFSVKIDRRGRLYHDMGRFSRGIIFKLK